MSNDVQLPTDGHLRDVSAGAANVVADHALTSVAVAFCLGVGTGIAVVGLMSLPESTRRDSTAQRLGQHLLESMTSLVPRSLKID